MKKEILEQAVLDYINEKFKDKLVDKRVQTFFTYSELVDTVFSFAALLNKNIEILEKENTELKEKATKILKEAQGYIENEDDELYDEIEQFLRETDIDNAIQKANESLDLDKIADEVEQDIKEQSEEVTIASVWEKRDEVPLKLKVNEVYYKEKEE